MVDTLERAAALEGGLTRANVMNAAWATNFEVPLILGGTFKVDGVTDAYGAEYAEMLQYDAAKGSQVRPASSSTSRARRESSKRADDQSPTRDGAALRGGCAGGAALRGGPARSHVLGRSLEP